MDHQCPNKISSLCHSGNINKSGEVVSTVTANEYRVNETLSFVNGEIYVITVTADEYRVDKTLSFVNGEIYVITVTANEYRSGWDLLIC